MLDRLIIFLEKKNPFYHKQFGIHAHHSTHDVILSIIDKLQLAIEKRNYSRGIFLDFIQ